MQIFKSAPEGADITNSRVLGGAVASPRSLSHAFPRVVGSDATARLPYIADQNNYSMDGSDPSGQSQTRWRPSGGYYSQVNLGKLSLFSSTRTRDGSSTSLSLNISYTMCGSAPNHLCFVPLDVSVSRDFEKQPNIKEPFKEMPVITCPISNDWSTANSLLL